ncbi:MAG: sel1 repeat family protein [Geminicoccaceae bacterium]|nr:sel1 repeat family protein [Geminicoccaceae bacterium]MCB9945783.1 sel1 repeat family protein [Geminicoccaceae bacterium]
MPDTKNDEDRIAALTFAAEDGQAEAMFLLGVSYAQGQGVERNETAAARWFHQASKRGHARARTSMGYLYSIGKGVRHDVILGFLFLTQASEMGDLLAKDLLSRLRKQMNPAQLREAEKRVRDRAVS